VKPAIDFFSILSSSQDIKIHLVFFSIVGSSHFVVVIYLHFVSHTFFKVFGKVMAFGKSDVRETFLTALIRPLSLSDIKNVIAFANPAI